MREGSFEQRVFDDALNGRNGRRLLSGLPLPGIVTASVLATAGLALFAAAYAFVTGSPLVALVGSLAVVAFVAVLTLDRRDLRVAEATAAAALERAHEAETTERARADQLARVLEATQGLRLAGDRKLDYLAVLAAITPPGATSFLVRKDADGEAVESAHGPLAPQVVGLRMPAGTTEKRVVGVQSFSAHGHAVGEQVLPEHTVALGAPIESAIAIPLDGP